MHELIKQYTLPVIHAYMGYIRDNAEEAVRDLLKETSKKYHDQGDPEKKSELTSEDWMDDGSRIALKVRIDPQDGSAYFDFSGTSPMVYGNWNAPPSVCLAPLPSSRIDKLTNQGFSLHSSPIFSLSLPLPPVSLSFSSPTLPIGYLQCNHLLFEVPCRR